MAVAVVGAGQAGLATAALLRREGVPAVVLERTAVGATWRAAYDRLTLNTDRRLSSLPGLAVPAAAGRWVPRDAFVAYLEGYAAAHDLDVRLGVDVARVERGPRWRLRGPDGALLLTADRVVVATGPNRVPVVPDWPGLAGFPGRVLHSGEYRRPEPFAGSSVLVVGAGNSGAEIAADLADAGVRTTLSVRGAPGLLPRAVGPWPTQLSAFGLQVLPPRVADLAVAAGLAAVRGRSGPFDVPTRLVSGARTGTVPVLDAGLLRAVREGRVEVVPAVVGVDGPQVRVVGGGRVRPDVVVAATGWRPGLEGLVGGLGVLDERGLPVAPEPLPGLHLVGFGTPLTGAVHAAGHEAARVVDAVRRAGRLRRTVTLVRSRLPLPA